MIAQSHTNCESSFAWTIPTNLRSCSRNLYATVLSFISAYLPWVLAPRILRDSVGGGHCFLRHPESACFAIRTGPGSEIADMRPFKGRISRISAESEKGPARQPGTISDKYSNFAVKVSIFTGLPYRPTRFWGKSSDKTVVRIPPCEDLEINARSAHCPRNTRADSCV